MEAAEIVARCDAVIDQIERAMLEAADDPGGLEALRIERAAAIAQRAIAEQRAAAAERSARRRETPDELWEEWLRVRFLSRSRMSPKLKSRLIQRFGIENYRKLPA